MKTSKTILTLYFTICAVFALTAQTTHTVDNNPDGIGDFTELQAAVDAASDGDIIYVQPSSTNYGNTSITKQLTLVGRSHSLANYISSIGLVTFQPGSSNSIIKGLQISNIRFGISDGTEGSISNITITENKLNNITLGMSSIQTVDNILIRGNQLAGIDIRNTATNILITNNIITGGFKLICSNNPNSTLVTNNIFKITSQRPDNFFSTATNGTLNISNSIFLTYIGGSYNIGFSGNYQINNCLTYDYAGGTLNFAGNTSPVNVVSNTLLDTDPQFVKVDPSASEVGTSIAYRSNNDLDPYYDDVHLASGSPAIGAGSGGADLGIYDGGFNFKPFGQPTGVPTLAIEAYSSSVPKNSTLDVTITAQAH
ncbi:MAG: right-handed parallel beta-helix repeat-containing protein [Leeuwenhoekiella sp.]